LISREYIFWCLLVFMIRFAVSGENIDLERRIWGEASIARDFHFYRLLTRYRRRDQSALALLIECISKFSRYAQVCNAMSKCMVVSEGVGENFCQFLCDSLVQTAVPSWFGTSRRHLFTCLQPDVYRDVLIDRLHLSGGSDTHRQL